MIFADEAKQESKTYARLCKLKIKSDTAVPVYDEITELIFFNNIFKKLIILYVMFHFNQKT